ncbi:MAG: hypothetical protein HY471_01830 [Candidatus Sungbacteria bacterium]|nr:hypothetical protein [Candidatus Sungbacteria bacterium]
MSEPYALSGLLNGIFALSVGALVIAKNWREHKNQLFFLMTSAITLWALSYWRWLLASDYAVALFWVRLLSIGSLLIPVFYFHWVTAFLDIGKERRFLLRWVYLIAGLMLLSSFSALFVADVGPRLSFPFWPKPGVFYLPYLVLVYFGLVGYGVVFLLRAYARAHGSRKAQIFYILLGTVLGFGGGATNFFLWYNVAIPPYGNILVSLFPFLLGYAILKHQLFDVRVIAAELLVFAIALFLLIRALAADTLFDRVVEFVLLGVVGFFGAMLVRSIQAEIESREKITSLANELAEANKELKRLDEAKSEFISLAGHQLRTPLTVIKGYTSMVLEGTFGSIGDKARDALDKVFKSSGQLATLVTDLLDLSRIEAGRIRYEFKDLKLEDVVHGVMQELAETAKAKSITLNFRDENPAGRTILADFDKMHEVVMNIVDNAIKYSGRGTSVDILLQARERDRKMVLSVADHGMGIKPEDIVKLFVKFSRSEEAKRVRPDGMGLGLYLVKKIVEDHRGQAAVESPGLGKGSTFFVELPIS